MSTRSTIWIKNENGKFTGIYCHWDGYLENNGAILQEHYQDEKKVKNLIALGGISSLGKYVATNMPHSYEKPFPDTCVAYHRDRGEDFDQYADVKEKELPKYYEEFNYFFIDGKWKYTEAGEKEMKDLEKALSKIKKEEKE